MKLIIFTTTCLKTSSGSVLTTLNILDSLTKDIEVSLVVADSLIPEDKRMKDVDKDLVFKMKTHPRVVVIKNLKNLAPAQLMEMGDKAIVAIYNFMGEDGVIPALCALSGIKVMSSSSASSALCFNKEWTKRILSSSGIRVPAGILLDFKDPKCMSKAIEFLKQNKKIIVKPVACGASRGCAVCRDINELQKNLNNVLEFSDQVICEEFLEGREYTVGFIKNSRGLQVLSPVEIITERDFFDWNAKYESDITQEICPATTLTKENIKEVYKIVETIMGVFNLESHSRIDFIISSGKICVLEINTFPGLMRNSLFPKELETAGISLGTFITDYFVEA